MRAKSEKEAGNKKRIVVGVDFDNTIADYDDLMHAIAVERGLVAADFTRNKKLIRDAIRAQPDGESHWRGVQVTAYGPRMSEARLIEGVREFFLDCRRRGIDVYIVSHKTEYANFGEATVNLREAAAAWLDQQGFFDEQGIGLSRERVFFESTRAEKIERARSLGATHFIDDLEETFGEDAFPAEVEKILFSSHGQPTTLSDAVSFPTWREIHDRVLGSVDIAVLASLIGSEVRSVRRIGRGGNSKVYKVDAADGRSYAAKFYFQRTMDGLDRLEVEYDSLRFLGANGEKAVPRTIGVDRKSQIAVYEFVEGEAIDSASVSDDDIRQMAEFVGRLKGLSHAKGAEKLGRAAEACFSFDELAANIRGRIARLASAEGDSPSYSAFRKFLEDELRPRFESLVESIRSRAGEDGAARVLDEAKRTLSPSDFGFHNALRRRDGSILVLDLEYFGWDDPAKLISDFVLHPAMTLSAEAKRAYVTGMLRLFSDDESLPGRLELIYPLFAIKWCTILLNEFVPDFLRRREFAGRPAADSEEIRARQLEKAKAMLAAADHTEWLSPRQSEQIRHQTSKGANAR